MGLNIVSYQNLKPFKAEYDNEKDICINAETGKEVPWQDYLIVSINPEFASQAVDLKEGYYLFDDKSRFSAGTYSGYNDWRESLAKLAGYPFLNPDGDDARHGHSRAAWLAEGGDFWELINFTDCDGIIGSKVSKKLFLDFSNNRNIENAKALGSGFFQTYMLFKDAFSEALNNGAVVFQ